TARGPVSIPVAGREDRARQRAGRRPPKGVGDRLCGARDWPPRGDRHRPGRGGDGSLLARLFALAACSRPVRVKLCVSDAHTVLKNAIGQVLGVPWQRCTVHFLRDMLCHVQKSQQQMVGAAIRQIFAASAREEAAAILGDVVDRLQAPAPKVSQLLQEAEDDLLAFLSFPTDHRSKLRSTNPLERVNREIARRSDVVGIYPNDHSLIRLAGCLLIEQGDEWLVQKRYLSQESLTALYTNERCALVDVDQPALQRSAGRRRPERRTLTTT